MERREIDSFSSPNIVEGISIHMIMSMPKIK